MREILWKFAHILNHCILCGLLKTSCNATTFALLSIFWLSWLNHCILRGFWKTSCNATTFTLLYIFWLSCCNFLQFPFWLNCILYGFLKTSCKATTFTLLSFFWLSCCNFLSVFLCNCIYCKCHKMIRRMRGKEDNIRHVAQKNKTCLVSFLCDSFITFL